MENKYQPYIDIYSTVEKAGWIPDIKTITGISSEPEVTINGKKYILFCSANYLGLANDLRIKNAVIEGINQYGLHPTGSRLVSGTLDIHIEAEKAIAEFKHQQASMIFTTGTLANIGAIPALVNLPLTSAFSFLREKLFKDKKYIFSDQFNHATIIDGCRLSKAEVIVYNHADVKDLEKKISKAGKGSKLIVTDGVFSMDGDLAPLPELVHIAQAHKAILYVDDAHGTGVLGENGGGTAEYFGITKGIDVHMGTFSKSFGLLGGFIAGDKAIVDYLKISSRTYIFSGAFWGSITKAIIRSLDIVKNEPIRRRDLQEKSDYFRKKIIEIGYSVIGSVTPIIPIMIGDEVIAKQFSNDLFQKGIFAPPIIFPAVEKSESRIRFSMISTLTIKQIDYTLEVLAELMKTYQSKIKHA